jgi:hypothetical protein
MMYLVMGAHFVVRGILFVLNKTKESTTGKAGGIVKAEKVAPR